MMGVMAKLWRLVWGGPRDPHEGRRFEPIDPAIPGPDESQAARDRQHGHTVEGILAIVRRALKTHKPGWPVRVFIYGNVPPAVRQEALRYMEQMGYSVQHAGSEKGTALLLSPEPPNDNAHVTGTVIVQSGEHGDPAPEDVPTEIKYEIERAPSGLYRVRNKGLLALAGFKYIVGAQKFVKNLENGMYDTPWIREEEWNQKVWDQSPWTMMQ